MSTETPAKVWKLTEPHDPEGIPQVVQMDVVHATASYLVVVDADAGRYMRRYPELGRVSQLMRKPLEAGRVVRPYALWRCWYGATQEAVLQDWLLRKLTARDNHQHAYVQAQRAVDHCMSVLGSFGFGHLVDAHHG